MSRAAVDWVHGKSRARGSSRIVLDYLATFAKDERDGARTKCSWSTIGKATHLSRSTVARCISGLAASGEVMVRHRVSKAGGADWSEYLVPTNSQQMSLDMAVEPTLKVIHNRPKVIHNRATNACSPPCQFDTPPRVNSDTPPVSTVTPPVKIHSQYIAKDSEAAIAAPISPIQKLVGRYVDNSRAKGVTAVYPSVVGKKCKDALAAHMPVEILERAIDVVVSRGRPVSALVEIARNLQLGGDGVKPITEAIANDYAPYVEYPEFFIAAREVTR